MLAFTLELNVLESYPGSLPPWGVPQIVAVANDITFNSGAFGTKEDAVFRAATEHALEEKLPLVYLAANAGARVGLAQEVKQCLQVGGRSERIHINIYWKEKCGDTSKIRRGRCSSALPKCMCALQPCREGKQLHVLYHYRESLCS